MAKQQEKLQDNVEQMFQRFTGAAHKAFQVGLGAVMLVQDEVSDFVGRSEEMAEKMMERGETAEKDGRSRFEKMVDQRRKQANEFVERPRKQAQEWFDRAEDRFEEFAETTLKRANLPSHDDIEDLGKKVNTLSRKVDSVRQELEKEAVEA